MDGVTIKATYEVRVSIDTILANVISELNIEKQRIAGVLFDSQSQELVMTLAKMDRAPDAVPAPFVAEPVAPEVEQPMQPL